MCKYCDVKDPNYGPFLNILGYLADITIRINKNVMNFIIRDGEIDDEDTYAEQCNTKINFCPMCGRDLRSNGGSE